MLIFFKVTPVQILTMKACTTFVNMLPEISCDGVMVARSLKGGEEMVRVRFTATKKKVS